MSYPFADEQKLEANSVDLAEFLRVGGKQLKHQAGKTCGNAPPG